MQQVFLSYSWRNSLLALRANQVPEDLFVGNPWADPRRIKDAIESQLQHLYGHELECWLDIDRVKMPPGHGGASASRGDFGFGSWESCFAEGSGLVGVVVEAIRTSKAVVVFMSDEYMQVCMATCLMTALEPMP